MTFNPDYFRDIAMDAAAKAQFGAGASAFVQGDPHFWNWKVRRADGSVTGIDLALAATTQLGAGFQPVALSNHAYSWRALRFSDLKYKVIPIILVTGDKIFDIQGVQNAVETFKSHIIQSQEWIRQAVGKTIDCIAPLVYYTRITAAQCAQWNIDMKVEGAPNQRDYFKAFQQEVKNVLGTGYNEQYHKYLVTIYGAQQDGSVTLSPVALISSDVLTYPYKSFGFYSYSSRGDVIDDSYAIIHELGHVFGLPHPPVAEQNESRLMWNGRPGFNGSGGQFTSAEIAVLLQSPWFK